MRLSLGIFNLVIVERCRRQNTKRKISIQEKNRSPQIDTPLHEKQFETKSPHKRCLSLLR